MSYYKDIYNDYPIRCGKLWRKLRKQAEDEKLDVTFMLMTAAGGMAAIYEHVKQQSLALPDSNMDHPAIEDSTDPARYTEIRKKMLEAIDGPASKSCLLANVDYSKWFYRKVERLDQIRECVEFRGPVGLARKIQSPRDAISVFRNALAHNNIYAFNRGNAKEIDEIAFFKEDRKKDKDTGEYRCTGYVVLAIPHLDFRSFLDSWFDMLQDADPKTLRAVLNETLDDGSNLDADAA
jgi:hypothetical protein